MMMGMDELTGPVSCWNGGGSSVGDDYENESVIDLLDILDFPAECLEGDGFGDDFDESQLGPIPSDAFTASIHVPHAFIRNESSSAAFKLNASQTNDPKPFLAQNKYSEFVMFQTHSPVSVLDSSASCLGGKAGPIKTDFTVPVRPRSKRARSSSVNPWLSISPIVAAKKKGKKKPSLKSALSEASSKKCKHCGVTKTPQWREGPQGPKTLCNACGVRYRSGRLFPEYRPAASPTFVPSLHSNSHRKVIEMRRKSMQEGGFQEDDPLLEFVPMNSHLFDCIY